jgi:hypothetical protein
MEECWYCFSVLARYVTDGKSRQQQFEELYFDDSDDEEPLFETAALDPLQQ